MLIDVHVTVESRGRSKFVIERSIDHTNDAEAEELQGAIGAAIKHLQRQPREVSRKAAGGDDQ